MALLVMRLLPRLQRVQSFQNLRQRAQARLNTETAHRLDPPDMHLRTKVAEVLLLALAVQILR
jgi:hypothetical protein